jgi:hypothetical protein
LVPTSNGDGSSVNVHYSHQLSVSLRDLGGKIQHKIRCRRKLGNSTGPSANDPVESLIPVKNTGFSGRFDHEVSVRATHHQPGQFNRASQAICAD